MNLDDHQALYRFFNPDGELLYVGVTNSLPHRMTQHEDSKPWWHLVDQVTVEHYPNRAEVLAAEKEAIITEQPRFNVVHNGRVTGSARRAARRPARPAARRRGPVDRWLHDVATRLAWHAAWLALCIAFWVAVVCAVIGTGWLGNAWQAVTR